MCDQQSLRSACAYAQSYQSLCWSLEYSVSVQLLTEHHFEFLSLKEGCTGLSESIHFNMEVDGGQKLCSCGPDHMKMAAMPLYRKTLSVIEKTVTLYVYLNKAMTRNKDLTFQCISIIYEPCYKIGIHLLMN